MHYVIIGAGAVGGTIGGRLHQHGHRVTLVARGAHREAIQQHGLLLATPDGEHRLRIPVLDGPEGVELEPDSVLVLAVKSQDTMAALAGWADVPVRGGGVAADQLPVLCAQNGVANERLVLRLFARVCAVCVWMPGTYLTPGTIVAEGDPRSGVLHLGWYPARASAGGTLERIAADLTASRFAAPVREDVMRWKYGKLLGNLGNGVQALFGLDSNDWLTDLYRQARAEGAAALDAAGHPYSSGEEEAAGRDKMFKVAQVAGRTRGGGSTWQSLARGAGSVEVDYLNGEIVMLGREHGVPTPVNLAVQLAVRRAARDGIDAGKFPVDEFQALLDGA